MANGYLRNVPSDADPNDGRLYDPTSLGAQTFTVEGLVSCISAITPAIVCLLVVAGLVSAQSVATSPITRTWAIAGTTTAQSTASSDVRRTWALAGTTAAQSGASSVLARTAVFSGTTATQSAASAALARTWVRDASTAAQSAITGATTRGFAWAGPTTAQSTVTGDGSFTPSGPTVWTYAGTTTGLAGIDGQGTFTPATASAPSGGSGGWIWSAPDYRTDAKAKRYIGRVNLARPRVFARATVTPAPIVTTTHHVHGGARFRVTPSARATFIDAVRFQWHWSVPGAVSVSRPQPVSTVSRDFAATASALLPPLRVHGDAAFIPSPRLGEVWLSMLDDAALALILGEDD